MVVNRTSVPRVLTIAGSDSGGGAGLQADLKTFAAFGVYGTSVVTAVTAQNTMAVQYVEPIPSDIVRAQLESVLSDIGTDAAKTGMLCSADTVGVVANSLRSRGVTSLVVDPVREASTGASLGEVGTLQALMDELLPIALVVTPNVGEAESLAGISIAGRDDVERAARTIALLGARNVLMKGGHLEEGDASDYLFDGRDGMWIPGERVPGIDPHGTGCTYAAAIAAQLAMGNEIAHAVREAKRYVAGAIRGALELGSGARPLDHAWESRTESNDAS